MFYIKGILSLVVLVFIIPSVHPSEFSDVLNGGQTKVYEFENNNYEIKFSGYGYIPISTCVLVINGGRPDPNGDYTDELKTGDKFTSSKIPISIYIDLCDVTKDKATVTFTVASNSPKLSPTTPSCSNECSNYYEKWCVGDDIYSCYQDELGCWVARKVDACPSVQNYRCEYGACVRYCTNKCSFSGTSCIKNSVYSCYDGDGDGCTDLLEVQNCGSDLRCLNGECTSNPECTSNEGCESRRECKGGRCLLRTGCKYHNDPCKPGFICIDNRCVPTENIERENCHFDRYGRPAQNGDFDYCSKNCKCKIKEGDCDSDAECENNGICRINVGRPNPTDYLFGYDKCYERKPLTKKTDSYPVIFVHGHTPSHGTNIIQRIFGLSSTVDTLTYFGRYGYFEQFQKFVRELENYGYYNEKGYVTGLDIIDAERDCEPTSWGKNIALKTTYYQQDVKCINNTCWAMSDDESISEYAKRLSKSIEVVKRCTGAEKVNIIAHSMGGLVARKYIVNGGSNSVNKLIMLGTPNKGTETGVGWNAYCTLGHPGKECDDMWNYSKFIQDLNSIPKSSSVVYITIAGINEGDNDGTVKMMSVHLDYSYQANVSCGHGALIEPDECPDAFNFVAQVLQDNYSNFRKSISQEITKIQTSNIKEANTKESAPYQSVIATTSNESDKNIEPKSTPRPDALIQKETNKEQNKETTQPQKQEKNRENEQLLLIKIIRLWFSKLFG